jgi:HAMP domain-containing protein
MGAVKEIRKQAIVAERAAARMPDPVVADQMKALAEAFRAQAEAMKKKKKKKRWVLPSKADASTES